MSLNVAFSEEQELATITFPSALKIGFGNLHIKYTGLLNDKVKGFYINKYIDSSGKERYSAKTQFQVNIFVISWNFIRK